jgi:Fe-S cluster assembly scaffold protein SufB
MVWARIGNCARISATVGPIDEDQLFYLAARGLSRAEAERMIVGGFFEPLLARIPDETVREEVRGRVEARLAR